MISRRATRLMGEAYTLAFSTKEVRRRGLSTDLYRQFKILNDELRDFLYDEEYPDWLLFFLNVQSNVTNERILKDRIMNFHTGEAFRLFKNPYTDKSAEERRSVGQLYLRSLAQSIIRLSEGAEQAEQASQLITALKSQLELEGYVYRNGKLYDSEASVIDEQEEHSYLDDLVVNLRLNDAAVIRHHLNRSEEHFIGGKWDDSISNSRKVLDAILKQITEALHLKIENAPAPAGLLKNAFQTRQYLETKGLITTAEREALDKSYGVLSVTGGHPYIAEKDQARLMRHLALTFSQFALLRYQGFLANNP